MYCYYIHTLRKMTSEQKNNGIMFSYCYEIIHDEHTDEWKQMMTVMSWAGSFTNQNSNDMLDYVLQLGLESSIYDGATFKQSGDVLYDMRRNNRDISDATVVVVLDNVGLENLKLMADKAQSLVRANIPKKQYRYSNN